MKVVLGLTLLFLTSFAHASANSTEPNIVYKTAICNQKTQELISEGKSLTQKIEQNRYDYMQAKTINRLTFEENVTEYYQRRFEMQDDLMTWRMRCKFQIVRN